MKVIVTYIRIYSQEMEITTLLVRDLCVTLEMLSQWVSNYLRSIQKPGIRHSLDLRLWSWPFCSWQTFSHPQGHPFPNFKLLIFVRTLLQRKMKIAVHMYVEDVSSPLSRHVGIKKLTERAQFHGRYSCSHRQWHTVTKDKVSLFETARRFCELLYNYGA